MSSSTPKASLRKPLSAKHADKDFEPQMPGSFSNALLRLDEFLKAALERLISHAGPDALLDPWRGMHMDRKDVDQLLDERRRGCSVADAMAPDVLAEAMKAIPRVANVVARLGLSVTDLAILLLVLAPDLELRYQRIYGYLQDDLNLRRPATDFLANLLGDGPAARAVVAARLRCDAPLRQFAMLELDPGNTLERGPMGRAWRVDEVWRDWLLGRTAPDCDDLTATDPSGAMSLDELPLQLETRQSLEGACTAVRDLGLPLRLLLQGPSGTGKKAAATAIARQLNLRVLRLDICKIETTAEMRRQFARYGRAAALFGSVLYVEGLSSGERRDANWMASFFESAAQCPGHLILADTDGLHSWHGTTLPLLRVAFSFPDAQQRLSLWQTGLRELGAETEEGAESPVAMRFALSAAQIRQAAAEAQLRVLLQGTKKLRAEDLAAAARNQSGGELAQMAQRIVPAADFDNLVVPAEVKVHLRELCDRVATRDVVGRDWAAGSVHARAAGVTALFAGPSGTGKTLAAEALARELGLDLYRIDLAGIVSKYIGETEKNLDRVFAAAERSNAVLFFDEADALFGKRSEVKDAHDRYANLEIAYLLQKMEQFDGLAILATNLKQNLDEAFIRRLTFTINFPFPEVSERQRLWEVLWPPKAPRGDDVDLNWFAREFRLSGGNIRNTVLAAAHLAAADGQIITREHLLHATQRECLKVGKILNFALGSLRE